MAETLQKIEYEALNLEVCREIPLSASKILDVGCGTGALGEYLKSRQQAIVHGLTYSENEAALAGKRLDAVVVTELNNFECIDKLEVYDCIVCSHILEHLYDPWKFVQKITQHLSPGGHLIVAIPNVLFWKQRFKFLLGHFKYEKTGGLMDFTHYRFFDWNEADTLFNSPGLRIESKRAAGMFPQPLIRKAIPAFSKKLDEKMSDYFPGLFGLQFIYRLVKT